MSIQTSDFIQAAGKWNSTGAGTGSDLFAAGGRITTAGAGVYTLTLDQPLDANEGGVLVTPVGAAPAADLSWAVEDTSDTVKTIHATAAGVATDSDFLWVAVKGPNLSL